MSKDQFDQASNKPMKDSSESTLRDKLGDAVEKVGHKISDAGAKGLGQKIHDLGDKIEKSHDNKTHPHDV